MALSLPQYWFFFISNECAQRRPSSELQVSSEQARFVSSTNNRVRHVNTLSQRRPSSELQVSSEQARFVSSTNNRVRHVNTLSPAPTLI